MPETLPGPARILGPAGLLPFGALVLLALLVPEWRAIGLSLLHAYGATIAAFLGAVHWGLAMRPAPGEEGAVWGRMGLGVTPALLAWVALMMPLRAGLVGLAAILLTTALVETLAARHGLVPMAYMRLRWGLSLGASACLLLGATLA
ncbi:DUF3429 domain-containing protein [Roseomonas sp. SSH11]|uniref:DUF3429 domain-containing protein n=1 Tax=Pararoseomonas baculiformis TaxID=2820812 RepID=A0ABS4AAW4_9PROT|nr:DUF3429 domain-containing protein [Pararoseomonas baculiformis]MBP0444139.1 DUF3429 domain-containing protein [Pararoseomonas baculiformis]